MTKSDISMAGPESVGLAFASKHAPDIFKHPAFFSVISVPAPWLEWEGGRDRDFRE
ncbi:hypothetical protein [Bradyrhizobium sp. USDA 3364]